MHLPNADGFMQKGQSDLLLLFLFDLWSRTACQGRQPTCTTLNGETSTTTDQNAGPPS